MMKNLTVVVALAVLSFSQLSVANTVILPDSFEPALISFLDDEFGLENLQRIDDDMDQSWTVTGEITATSIVKKAGYSQNFGLNSRDNDFSSLLYVPYNNNQKVSLNEPEIGSQIQFNLIRGGMSSSVEKSLFSSDVSSNNHCPGNSPCSSELDYMVSWLIIDGEYAGDYILAWEDTKFLGDRDYNDLIVQVSGVSYSAVSAVPVPAAIWLFGSGLIGLAVIARRRI